MAPRRNSSVVSAQQHQQPQQQNHQQQIQQHQQQQQHHSQQQQLHTQRTLFGSFSATALSSSANMAPMQQTLNVGVQLTRCCYPNGECAKLDALIALDEQGLAECVRVLCNNENCNVGQYMHRECFEQWEASVLQQLKASGRARNWSERQRQQQLWSKKVYDLINKNCNCKCGRGQLRKDLEWPPSGVCFAEAAAQPAPAASLIEDDDKKKAKKKRNRNGNGNGNNNNNGGGGGGGQKQSVGALTPLNTNAAGVNGGGGNLTPNPNVGVIGSGLPHNNNNNIGQNNNSSSSNVLQPSVVATLSNILMSSNNVNNNNNNVLGLDLRARAGSLSSSGSSSPSASASQSSADISLSPVQQQQQQQLHLQQQQLLLPNNNYASNLILPHNGLGLAKSLQPLTLLAPPPQSQQQQPPQSQPPPQLPALANISNFKPLASFDQQQLVQQQRNKEVELYSERVR